MWNAIVWNTVVAGAMAVALKLIAGIPWVRRRPALVQLGWALVLLKLVVPSFVALPVWTETASRDLFRWVDEATLASRTGQVAGIFEFSRKGNEATRQADSEPAKQASQGQSDLVSVPKQLHRPTGTLSAVVEATATSREGAASFAFLFTWATVSGLYFCYVSKNHRHAFAIQRCAEVASGVSRRAEDVARILGCRKPPEIRVVDGKISPGLVGWFKPSIVLPRWALERLSPQRLSAILAHEIAHYQRGDHLFSSLSCLIRGMLWWNPLAWWAGRELRHWQELSCDALVIARGIASPGVYADSLWQVLQSVQPEAAAPQSVLPVVPRRPGVLFRQRLLQLLDGGQTSQTPAIGWIVLATVAAIGLCYPSVGATVFRPGGFEYVSSPDSLAFVEVIEGWQGLRSVPAIDERITGTVTLHGRFWFGTSDRPVFLALCDRDSQATSQLIVDTNRDGFLARSELAQFVEEGTWKAPVRLQPVGDQKRDDNSDEICEIFVRKKGGRLEVSQAGYLHGKVEVGDRSVNARIEDRNCNGIWTDQVDRLHIDVNGDGRFSPLHERFSCQGAPKISGVRYALAFGDDTLRLESLDGTGNVVATIKLVDEDAKIDSCHAVLVSRNGVHITLKSTGVPVEVPAGEYALARLRFTLHGDRMWAAVFEQASGPKRIVVSVKQGRTSEFDLLGELTLSAEVIGGDMGSPGQEQLVVQPRLNTETGLFLASSTVGKLGPQDDNALVATFVRAGTPEESAVEVAGTGFSCGAFCPITFSEPQFGSRVGFEPWGEGAAGKVILRFDSGPLAGVLERTIEAENAGGIGGGVAVRHE